MKSKFCSSTVLKPSINSFRISNCKCFLLEGGFGVFLLEGSGGRVGVGKSSGEGGDKTKLAGQGVGGAKTKSAGQGVGGAKTKSAGQEVSGAKTKLARQALQHRALFQNLLKEKPKTLSLLKNIHNLISGMN